MRVMTLNTKNGNADAEQIVSIVRDQHVEVLAMQEVSGSLIERLSAAGLDELLPSRVIGLAGAGDNGGVNVIYTLAPMRNASESILPLTGSAVPACTIPPDPTRCASSARIPHRPRRARSASGTRASPTWEPCADTAMNT